MKIEKEVYNEIKWDPRYNEEKFLIEYRDREDSCKKVPFAQFSPNGDIPWHRVVRFYYRDLVVWDRENKIEQLGKVHETEFSEENEIFESADISELKTERSKGYRYNSDEKSWVKQIGSENIEYKGSLSLLTCNVLCDFYEPEKGYAHLRYPALIEFLKNKADIIHLQEVTEGFAKLLAKEDWVRENYYLSDTDKSLWKPFGVITLSRFPIEDTFYIHFSGGRRPALISRIDVKGFGVLSVNLHLSSNRRGGAQARRKETEMRTSLIAEMDESTVIISGDFNFNDNSESQPITGSGFIDLDRYFYGDEKNFSYDPEVNKLARQLSPMGTERRMDRVYLRSAFGKALPSYFEVIRDIIFSDGLFLTDHFPVYSEFDLSFKEEVKETYGYGGSILFETRGFLPFNLLSLDIGSKFPERVKELVRNSLDFETISVKQDDKYIISSSPGKRIFDLSVILSSSFPGSVPLSDFVTKGEIEEENSKFLISVLKDKNGNIFPVDFLSLDEDSEIDEIESSNGNKALPVIEYLMEKYSLKLIGSYFLDSAVSSSDIDFFSERPVNELLKDLKEEFDAVIKGERTKCIKFEYESFTIDIQFDKNALKFNESLHDFYSKSPERKNLLKLVKHWSEMRHINRQAFGFLSGTALSVLVKEFEGDSTITDFFNNADFSSLPVSCKEMMTESSKTIINFELERAKELIRSGNLKKLFEKRSFVDRQFIRILPGINTDLVRSGYLKLSRIVEQKGGMIDVIDSDGIDISLFGFENPELFLERYLGSLV